MLIVGHPVSEQDCDPMLRNTIATVKPSAPPIAFDGLVNCKLPALQTSNTGATEELAVASPAGRLDVLAVSVGGTVRITDAMLLLGDATPTVGVAEPCPAAELEELRSSSAPLVLLVHPPITVAASRQATAVNLAGTGLGGGGTTEWFHGNAPDSGPQNHSHLAAMTRF